MSSDGRVCRVTLVGLGDPPYVVGIMAPGFDPLLAEAAFALSAPSLLDVPCGETGAAPPASAGDPAIDYLAKDYATFRRLMLDRIGLLAPGWQERNPADVGMALVEMLAHVGDLLAYEQDAIATEAYLGTARRRVSVRRHARLIDYAMHDGRNARAWVQVRVDRDVLGNPEQPVLPAGRTAFLTQTPGIPSRLGSDSPEYAAAITAGATVFEAMSSLESLFTAHNRLPFYTWGGERCVLPRGATRATLRGDQTATLLAGQVLVFIEERGPVSGRAADADPSRRHAVRLTEVRGTEDLLGSFLEPEHPGGGGGAVPLTEIAWGVEDALPFALCLATLDAHGGAPITDVSVALGNVVLVDHGRTIGGVLGEELPAVPAPTLRFAATDDRDGEPGFVPVRYAPHLQQQPLTQVAQVLKNVFEKGREQVILVPFDAGASAAAALYQAPAAMLPALSLEENDGLEWTARRDLLASGPLARDFVAEVDEDGFATLRFGDDRFSKRPETGASFRARYRVGNGRAGNIGANAIAHLVSDAAALTQSTLNLAVTNPLPAVGGEDPESLEDVRQRAPGAFRRQERAVTADDYAAMAMRHPEVQRAAATLRWTGSWRTVFLTVDRLGGAVVDQAFKGRLREFLERFRLAGDDLEIDAPRFVPLRIVMRVALLPDARGPAVIRALHDTFSSRLLADGRRGFFHPDNLTFGQRIYLSQLYATALAVPGVAHVNITLFQRRGDDATDASQTGELTMGRLEIARLEDDQDLSILPS
jgi:hypothetical protein